MDEGSDSARRKKWVIIAVLGGVAFFAFTVGVPLLVYGVKTYLTGVKSAEAREVTQEIASGIARCASGGTLPESSRPVPAALALVNGMKYASKPGDWSDPAFRCAGFARSTPQYFQYQWQRLDPQHGVVIARADFNQDGTAETGFDVEVSCSGAACAAAASPMDIATGSSGTAPAPSWEPSLGFLVAIFAGSALLVAGSIWTLVLAFMDSLLWGFLVLLVPCASVVFTIKNWKVARWPFLLQVAAFNAMLVFAMVAGTSDGAKKARAAAAAARTQTAPAVPSAPVAPIAATTAAIPSAPAPEFNGSSAPATDLLAEAQSRATKWEPGAFLVAIEVRGLTLGKVATYAGGVLTATYRRTPGTSRSKGDQLVVTYDDKGFREQESNATVPLPSLPDPSCSPERIGEIATAIAKGPIQLNLEYKKDRRSERIVWIAKVPESKQAPRIFDGASCTILAR